MSQESEPQINLEDHGDPDSGCDCLNKVYNCELFFSSQSGAENFLTAIDYHLLLHVPEVGALVFGVSQDYKITIPECVKKKPFIDCLDVVELSMLEEKFSSYNPRLVAKRPGSKDRFRFKGINGTDYDEIYEIEFEILPRKVVERQDSLDGLRSHVDDLEEQIRTLEKENRSVKSKLNDANSELREGDKNTKNALSHFKKEYELIIEEWQRGKIRSANEKTSQLVDRMDPQFLNFILSNMGTSAEEAGTRLKNIHETTTQILILRNEFEISILKGEIMEAERINQELEGIAIHHNLPSEKKYAERKKDLNRYKHALSQFQKGNYSECKSILFENGGHFHFVPYLPSTNLVNLAEQGEKLSQNINQACKVDLDFERGQRYLGELQMLNPLDENLYEYRVIISILKSTFQEGVSDIARFYFETGIDKLYSSFKTLLAEHQESPRQDHCAVHLYHHAKRQQNVWGKYEEQLRNENYSQAWNLLDQVISANLEHGIRDTTKQIPHFVNIGLAAYFQERINLARRAHSLYTTSSNSQSIFNNPDTLEIVLKDLHFLIHMAAYTGEVQIQAQNHQNCFGSLFHYLEQKEFFGQQNLVKYCPQAWIGDLLGELGEYFKMESQDSKPITIRSYQKHRIEPNEANTFSKALFYLYNYHKKELKSEDAHFGYASSPLSYQHCLAELLEFSTLTEGKE